MLFTVLEESPNYVISMNVRSMNEPEDCPSMLLKLTYPEDYPESSPLQIEYDDESDDYEAEDYSELDVVLKEVVSVFFSFRNVFITNIV